MLGLLAGLTATVAICDPTNLPDANGHLTFPSGTVEIAAVRFKDCLSLRSMTIPGTVTYIGFGAFWGSNLQSLSLPNSITRIESSAFLECSGLTSVVIPDSVEFIGGGAFGAINMSTLVLSNSLTYVGDSAFQANPALSNVYIPDSVTFIGHDAFQSCTGLVTVYVSRSADPTESDRVFQFTGCNESVFQSGVSICQCSPGSCAPTSVPTASPTTFPTAQPTSVPTISPTATPTVVPTTRPTEFPTLSPTAPTSAPTSVPSVLPTAFPTTQPSSSTAAPTHFPSTMPTSAPSQAPTSLPTLQPTAVLLLRESEGASNELSNSIIAMSATLCAVAVCILGVLFMYLRRYPGARWFRRRICPKAVSDESAPPIIFSFATKLNPNDTEKKGEIALKKAVHALSAAGLSSFHSNQVGLGSNWKRLWFGQADNSEVAVVMLSSGYFTSKWCIYELVHLLESKMGFNNRILPIFVEDPGDYMDQHVLEEFFETEGMYRGQEKKLAAFVRSVKDRNVLNPHKVYPYNEEEIHAEVVDCIRAWTGLVGPHVSAHEVAESIV